MEPEIVDYIASEGEQQKWDIAILELGINCLCWEEKKMLERARNTLQQIAGRNQDKSVYVISPFYSFDDYKNQAQAKKWRIVIEQAIKELNYKNIRYINGLDLIGDMSLISADEVHPNIYGIAQVAERLTGLIKRNL